MTVEKKNDLPELPIIEVPCGACSLCCQGEAVRILPTEDATQWETEQHPFAEEWRMLAHDERGNCVYLRDGRCTIQSSKPEQCRRMDCRHIANALPRHVARRYAREGVFNFEVWRRGKELLRAKQ